MDQEKQFKMLLETAEKLLTLRDQADKEKREGDGVASTEEKKVNF